MSKTIEELAKEYVIEKYFKYVKREENDNYELLIEDFISGYQTAAPQWISVKDRLPKNDDDYLLAFRIGDDQTRLIEIGIFWFGHRGWDVPNSYKPIAWMPLLKPPEDK